MTHYVPQNFYNDKNDALATNSRRPNNSNNPYGVNDNSEYYDEYSDLGNPLNQPLNYGSDRIWTSETELTHLDSSYNNDYVVYYGKDDQQGVKGGAENWDGNNTVITADYGFDYANQKCTSTKLLPMLPANQNDSRNGAANGASSARGAIGMEMEMDLEGTYMHPQRDNIRHRGTCLPNAHDKDSEIDHGSGTCQNVYENSLNGYPDYSPIFRDNRVPASPLRVLPRIKARPVQHSNLSQNLFDLNTDSTNEGDPSIGGLTMRELCMPPPVVATSTYDAFGQMARPYTSMLPLDYTDYQESNYNADSLSTYSDTPPTTTTSAQHKLQQQRKISLMMAMTTASVIASGETRVPVHSSNKPEERTTTTESLLSASISMSTSTNATAIASEWWSDKEFYSGEVLTSTPITAMTLTSTTTRKLPKLLPKPQYKSSTLYTTSNLASDETTGSLLLSSVPSAEKNHRPKQLPKLPTSQVQAKKHSKLLPNLNSSTAPASVASLPLSSIDKTSAFRASPETETEISSMLTTKNLLRYTSHAPLPYYAFLSKDTEPNEVDVLQSENNMVLKSWPLSTAAPLEPHPCSSMDLPSTVTHMQMQLPNSPIASTPAKESIDSYTKLKLEPLLISPVASPETLTETIKETSSNISEPDATIFDISEYLKPYTLDSNSYSKEYELDHITIAFSTTKTINSSYGSENQQKNDFAPIPSSVARNSFVNYQPLQSHAEDADYSPTITPPVPIKSNLSDSPSPLSTYSHLFSKQTETSKLKEHATEAISPTKNCSHDTFTTTSWSNSYSHSDDVFTKTVFASSPAVKPIITSREASASASPSPSTLTSTSSTAPILSYTDYMKKFELPELPQPILEICTTSSPVSVSGTDANLSVDTDAIVWTENTEFESIKAGTVTSTSTLPSHSYLTELTESNLDTYKECRFPVECHGSNRDFVLSGGLIKIDDWNKSITVEPTGTIECSVDTPFRPINSFEPAEPSVSKGTEFDDTFYDSFNVDVTVLTASISHIESEICSTATQMPNKSGNNLLMVIQEEREIPVSKTNEKVDPVCLTEPNQSLNSGHGGYYKPVQKSPTPTQQKAKVVASAATSVLGGLSKGLKGGLDGVFSGVSSTVDTTQQANTLSKKGFGFGLASKLVPSVGGLLSSTSSSSSKQTQQEKGVTAALPTTTETISEENLYSHKLGEPYTHTTESATLTQNNESHVSDNTVVALSSTQYTSPSYGYVGSYDEFNLTDEVVSVVFLDHDEEYGFTEHSYSYPTSVEGYSCNESYKDIPINTKPGIASEAFHYLASKSKITESVAAPSSPIQVPTKTSVSSGTTGSSGSGMLGSIFGKAAAAVQSATQAVNQGASTVASAVAQKPLAPPSAARPSDAFAMSTHHAIKPPKTEMGSAEFDAIVNNDYNNQLTNQELPSGHYSSTGDDYENSNIKMHDFSPVDNKLFPNFYSNGNQGQGEDMGRAGAGQSQMAANAPKILPTVPPAGSTGKKLPTINGKSSLLIKQMPTEIFDDESDIDDMDIAIGKETSYCIDSEQSDYYMGQQTTPSSQPNGYYEHVNCGYDYREDYFNEEDEYKYLEQQRQQEQQQQTSNSNTSVSKRLQNQTKMMLANNQSSLDFIDEGQDDDFLYEHYQSEEDSGNYLDESSSGSIGIVEGSKTNKIDLACGGARKDTTEDGISQIKTEKFNPEYISLQLTTTHHPVQKQDSILQESKSNLVGCAEDHMSPDRAIGDEDINDKLADLADLKRLKSLKKKPLMRGETEEVVGGHMQVLRQAEITARQRWHWAYNKIIMQLNVSNT